MDSVKKGRQADRQHKGFSYIIIDHKPQETLDQDPVKSLSLWRPNMTGSNSIRRKEEAMWVRDILRKNGHSLHIFFFFLFLFVFVFVFRDRVSLCSPGCPGTHFVDQAGLELRNPPASASRVLGLKACISWSRFHDSQHHLFLFCFYFPCYADCSLNFILYLFPPLPVLKLSF